MKGVRSVTVRVFSLFFSILFFSLPVLAHEIPEGAVPFEKSETCSACHPLIYDEWKSSMHALSSLHRDNAHAAVHRKYADAMQEEGKPREYHCAKCHMPMVDNLGDLSSGKALPDNRNWKETDGVGCAFCHRIESIVNEKHSNNYRINGDGSFHSGNSFGKAPHKTAQSALFESGDVCMGCHSHHYNPLGAPICVMKEEGEGNCLACHMSRTDGSPAAGSEKASHSSHAMMGGHFIEMLKKAVQLDARVERGQGKSMVLVDVKNTIDHTFPSTMPMRMAFLKITAEDSKGNIVWANFKESPMEDKKAVFFKAFRGGEKVGVPAWKAESVAFDTRLKAGETRSLTYAIPLDDIEKISVVLIYKLFPPAAIQMMEIPEDGTNDKSFIVAKRELTL